MLGYQPMKYIYASSSTEGKHQQCVHRRVSVRLVNRLIGILKIKKGYLQVSITRRRIMSNYSIYSTLLPSPNVQTCNVEGKCLTFYLIKKPSLTKAWFNDFLRRLNVGRFAFCGNKSRLVNDTSITYYCKELIP